MDDDNRMIETLSQKLTLDMDLAIHATRTITEFCKEITNMEDAKRVQKLLLNMADELDENPRLDVHLQPWKLSEIIVTALYSKMRKVALNGEKLSEGVLFLYRYLQNYIYTSKPKAKRYYFPDGANVYHAKRNFEPIDPHRDVDKMLRAIPEGLYVHDFIFAKSFKDLHIAFCKLRDTKSPYTKRKICNFLKVYLSMFCLYEIFYYTEQGRCTFPETLEQKCIVLEKLFSIHSSDDYNEFFTEVEDGLSEWYIRQNAGVELWENL